VTDSLDEAVDAQAFELARNLTGGNTGELALDVEVAEAGDHVLSAHQRVQDIPVVIAEEDL
jgi:hypothetical protein